jgi:hypothetical protein
MWRMRTISQDTIRSTGMTTSSANPTRSNTARPSESLMRCHRNAAPMANRPATAHPVTRQVKGTYSCGARGRLAGMGIRVTPHATNSHRMPDSSKAAPRRPRIFGTGAHIRGYPEKGASLQEPTFSSALGVQGERPTSLMPSQAEDESVMMPANANLDSSEANAALPALDPVTVSVSAATVPE